VVILPEAFRQFSQARLLIFGAMLIIIMMTRPRGLFPEGAFRGTAKRLRERFNDRAPPRPSMAPPEPAVRDAPSEGS